MWVLGSSVVLTPFGCSGAFDTISSEFPTRLLLAVLGGLLIAVVVTFRIRKQRLITWRWYH